MKKLIALATIALFFVGVAPAAAQIGFGAHAGISVPMGDYGDTEATDAGFAEMGFSGGLDLWVPLRAVPGLSWYSSVDAIAHSTDEGSAALAGFDVPSDAGYQYYPLMTGVRFDIPAGTIGLFATGQVGLVVARPPAVDFGDGELGSEMSTKVGFSLGGGVQLTENIYAGLKYYPMGDVDWSWDDGSEETLPVSFFDVYVGFGVR